jgi:hypothetical protein
MSDGKPEVNEIVAGERVRSILARAAELDASGLAGVRRNELQKIAEEAGISAAAFNQAMEEAARPVPAPAPRIEPKRTAWWRVDVDKIVKSVLGFGAFGAILGFWAPQNDTVELSVLMLLITAAYRAYVHRKDGDGSAFRAQVVSMFTGLWFAYSIASPRPANDVQTGLPVIAALAVLIGSVIVSYRVDAGDQNAVPASSK